MDDEQSLAALRLRCERRDDALVVELAGEYDIVSKGRLADVKGWDEPAVTAVVVDMSQLEFMDSTGLSDVVALRSVTERHGVALRVRGTRPNVRQVFQIARLGDLLED